MTRSPSLEIAYLAMVMVGVVFFYRRRRSDALLVGFVASCLYFLPGLLGEIRFPYGGDAGFYASAIAPGAYGVMLLAVGTLITVTFGYDRFFGRTGRAPVLPLYDQVLPEALLAITVVGFAASIDTVGKGYLCIEKQDMLEHINGWYYIASYAAPFALVSAVAARKWWIAALALIVLAADMFIGFRASTSVAIVALCLAFGQALFQDAKRRNVFIVVALASGAGLFVMKQLAWNIKYTVSVDCAAARTVAPLPPTPTVAPVMQAAVSGAAVSAPVASLASTPAAQKSASEVSTNQQATKENAQAASTAAKTAPASLKATQAAAPAAIAARPAQSAAAAAAPASVPQASSVTADADSDDLDNAAVQFHLRNLEYTAKLMSSLSIYANAFSYSEPMVTQSILNEVVKRGFRTSASNVIDQALSGVPGGKSIFGIDVSKVEPFNSEFQPALFPKATFGMANNPWAQAFAAGGFVLVLAFALVYAFGLALLAAISSRVSPVVGALSGVLAAWWGFYGHRNDVLTQAGIMKMTVYLGLAALALNFAWGALVKYRLVARAAIGG
jgi:hypothetical protein